MLKLSGGELAAKALKREGVSTVFTLCGGHVSPIYKACEDEGIRVVDLRHEQAAAMAADAWARCTRRPGVAIVTAGPGVTNAFTGIANAWKANVPLVVLGGRSPWSNFDQGALQEMDHVEFVRPVTRFARTVQEARRVPEYVRMAFRHALAGKQGPVFLDLPLDILMSYGEVPDEELSGGPAERVWQHGAPDACARAAEMLLEAERPVVMAGGAVWWDRAEEALLALAEKLRLPVYTNGMARGAFPQSHELFFNHSRRTALEKADAIFVVGTPLDFRLNYGRSPTFAADARLIQVDVDAAELGKNRAAAVAIAGHAGPVLRQVLAAAAEPKEAIALHRAWLEQLSLDETKKRAKQAMQEVLDSVPVNHYRLCKEIARFVEANPDTIVVGDGGDIVACGSKVIPVPRPGGWMDAGPLGCLGVGAPYAIAAKLACPDRKVLILSGDGSFGLNGFEFDTAARFGLPIVAVIGNDAGWGQIRTPQQSLEGVGRRVATDLAPTRYDRVVEALGGYGEHVEMPDQVVGAIERAFASGRPACVNVPIDPKGFESQGYMRGL